MRILLADDNTEIRAALRLLLEELGEHDILEAVNEQQLLSAAGRDHVDVILLDWELPEGTSSHLHGGALQVRSGELIKELRRSLGDSKIIAMSGRPEAEEHSRAAGCDGFVSRHEPPDRLLALLNMAERR
jgi:CheY-like chemotaxis protein